jgi:hypothetical protein
MKWLFVTLNVLVAIGLLLLGQMAVAAHRAHAYSTYRELKVQGLLVERPEYDAAERLESIAAAGSYSLWIAWIGAGAVLVNAAIWASAPRTPSPPPDLPGGAGLGVICD